MKNAIILGSGRSGTSMLAGSLASSGYFFGEKPIRSRSSNPKGFFESIDINLLNEELLQTVVPTRHPAIGYLSRCSRSLAATLRSPKPVRGMGQLWLCRPPENYQILCSQEIAKRIRALIEQQPFCFKDPRFCYTLQIWRTFLKPCEVVYLCVFREPNKTIESIVKECATRTYLKSLEMTEEQADEVWRAMYENILKMHMSDERWMFIHYEQLFERRSQRLLEEVLETKIDVNFPDKRLRRSIGSYVPSESTQAVYSRLCGLAKYDAD